MTVRRDALLRQLGITQWTLRRPAALLGEVAVALPAGVRLVMVAHPLPAQDHPLMDDVTRSLGLTPRQVYTLTPEQVQMLPADTQCLCWWLGVEPSRDLRGPILSSPPLAELIGNAAAKRDLWRQITLHEQHL